MAQELTILSSDANGAFSLGKLARTDVQRIDIADVDLIITTKSGDRYLLPNAGIDAMGAHPPELVFSDSHISADQLLSQVGPVTNLKLSDTTPTSQQNPELEKELHKKEQDAKELKEKIEQLEKQIQAQQAESEKKAEEDKNHKQEHDKNADVSSITNNTETSVEKLLQEAKKIDENLHRSDKDYADPTHFTPPPAAFSAAPGLPPPISLTPIVSISMGNVVGTTTSGNFIFGGNGVAGSGADAFIGPRDVRQFSAATINGTSGADIIYTNGPLVGNADPTVDRSNNAKQFIINVAGYFTTLNDITISGVPSDVSFVGATNNGDGTWTLSSSAVIDGTPIVMIYNMDNWRTSGSNTFDLDFNVSGQSTRGVAFQTIQSFRFLYEDVTSVNQVSDPTLIYDSRGQVKQIYILPTADQPNIINSGEGNDIVYGSRGYDTITVGNGDDEIYAGGGDDIVVTGNGNNIIDLGSGNNTLTSGTGNDTISAGDGTNLIDAGNGTNSFTLGNGANTVTSGNGNDTLTAGNGNNILNLGGGVNIITLGGGVNSVTTGAGNDTLTAGNGNNTVNLGDGNNNVTLGNGLNFIITGTGDDIIINGTGAVTINAGDGANQITTGGGPVNITAGTGADQITVNGGGGTISAGAGANVINATTGNYTITTGVGNDNITVGDGNNVIVAGDGANIVLAGNGNNTITSGSGNDTLTAGNGNNIFRPGLGTNTITGGSGVNTLDYSAITTTGIIASIISGTTTGTGLADTFTHIQNISGGTQNDTLTGDSGNNIIHGGAGNDTITGNGGNDTLYGDNGDDTITGGIGNDTIYAGDGNNTVYAGTAGADFIYGGTGNNIFISEHAGVTYDGTNGGNLLAGQTNKIDYSLSTADMNINLQTGIGTGGLANGDRYTVTPTLGYNSINWIIGGTGNDTLTGSFSDDRLEGGAGDDTLSGGAGNNILIGGAGSNVYNMGSGADNIVGSLAGTDRLRYNLSSPSGVVVNLDSVSHSFVNSNGVTITVNAYSGSNKGVTAADANSFSTGDSFTPASGTNTSIEEIYGSNNSGGDIIYGGSGSLTYYGGAGKDYFYGGSANETIGYSSGADRLDGGGGTDTLFSFSVFGNDVSAVFYLDATADTNGNGIADYIDRGVGSLTDGGTTYAGFALGRTGGATLMNNFENLIGNSGNDYLVGDNNANSLDGRTGNNTIFGLGGNDFISAGQGANIIDGGSGTDTIDFTGSTSVFVFFADATFTGASDKTFYNVSSSFQARVGTGTFSTIVNAENINGSSVNDVLYGNSVNNTINGGDGDDVLAGNGGTDVLNGGNGNDIMYATAAQAPTVTFNGGAGTDTVSISNLAVTAGSITSANSRFVSVETLDVRNNASGNSYTMHANDVQSLADAGTASSITFKLDSGDTFTVATGAGTGALSYLTASSNATDTVYWLYSDAGHSTLNTTNRVGIIDVHIGA